MNHELATYWFMIITSLLLTLVVAVGTIPFLILFPPWIAGIFLFLLGLLFGALLHNGIIHLNISSQHVILAGILLALVGGMAFSLALYAAHAFSLLLTLPQSSPFVVLGYVCGLLVPVIHGAFYRNLYK